MIGENLPHHPQSAAEARAIAAAIAALRAEIECIEEAHKPQVDYFNEQAGMVRKERDLATKPLAERAESLRKRLATWLEGDPQGSLKDGERTVATMAKGKPIIHVDFPKLPAEYLKPNMAAIEAAVRQGAAIPGVTTIPTHILKVF